MWVRDTANGRTPANSTSSWVSTIQPVATSIGSAQTVRSATGTSCSAGLPRSFSDRVFGAEDGVVVPEPDGRVPPVPDGTGLSGVDGVAGAGGVADGRSPPPA